MATEVLTARKLLLGLLHSGEGRRQASNRHRRRAVERPPGVCFCQQGAVPRRAEQAAPRRATKGGKGRKSSAREREGGVTNEEVYSISRGWQVDPYSIATEAELATLGVPVPERTRRQMNKERDAKEAQQAPAKVAPQVRTTHKMMRMQLLCGAEKGVESDDIVGTDSADKVMAGRQSNRRLRSPNDQNVRPMMEVVRGAVFSMLQVMAGSAAGLPGGRWLDLYSGTGSVGIEALSRGCDSAHFVECDPWVVSSVLRPNLEDCSFTGQAVVHSLRVENFLERAAQSGGGENGTPFDYISVTPPYEAVTYPTLMDDLGRSPVVGKDTCIVVEYPLRSKQEMPETCGPLLKIRDRRYGRTHLAIYGPEWASQD